MVYPYGFCNTADYKTIYFINSRYFFISHPDTNHICGLTTANHTPKINNPADEIADLDAEIGNHDPEIDSHDAVIGNPDSKITNLADEIGNLAVEIGNPDAEIGNPADEIANLDAEIGSHDPVIGSHDAEIGSHDAEIGNLEGKIDGLFAENINCGVVNKSHEGRIYSRNATVDGNGSEFKLMFFEN